LVRISNRGKSNYHVASKADALGKWLKHLLFPGPANLEKQKSLRLGLGRCACLVSKGSSIHSYEIQSARKKYQQKAIVFGTRTSRFFAGSGWDISEPIG
jgi:hypothetical protein